jgi:peptidyl-prolyl cis-trans isomerase D
MLDAMRRGVANILAKILLGLLIVAFAVWGIGDYLVRGARTGPLATVGNTEISVDEFQQAYKDESQVLARRLGRAITPEQAQLLGLGPRALARLIGFAAIDQHANALGVTVTDAIVRGSIMGDPSFHGPGGQFSKDQFYRLLRDSGFRSENQYIEARRRDLSRQQLTETLGTGAAPQPFLIDALFRYRNEKRVIEHVTPDFSKLVTIAEPSQEKLKEFFQQTRGQYVAPEERKASLLMLTREAALSGVSVTDAQVKEAWEKARDSFNVPEKRRVQQLTFSDKAAAEKAHAELSKAKNFTDAAAKAGFPASDIDLGLLTKAEMIDPKIRDAAFALKKDELSRPVDGQFSTVLLRITEIEPAKTRTFDDVKAEIRERIADERVGQQIQALHEQVEAGRAKGTPLKEIAQELKLSFKEIESINRTGKTADGKAVVAHPDSGRIVEAIFAATPGVETDPIELVDGTQAWFDLLGVTPDRERPFEEVAAAVRDSFIEEERQKEIAVQVAKALEGLKPGEGLERIAKSLGGKVERTAPVKRTDPPPAGLTPGLLQQAFASAKGAIASMPTPNGKSRTIFRVADIVAAGEPSAEEAAALKADLAGQLRIDLLDQYVGGLRTQYGFTVNEKLLQEAISGQRQETPAGT